MIGESQNIGRPGKKVKFVPEKFGWQEYENEKSGAGWLLIWQREDFSEPETWINNGFDYSYIIEAFGRVRTTVTTQETLELRVEYQNEPLSGGLTEYITLVTEAGPGNCEVFNPIFEGLQAVKNWSGAEEYAIYRIYLAVTPTGAGCPGTRDVGATILFPLIS